MSQLDQARTLYGSAMPTKTSINIFVFWGNSMVNGFATQWTELSAADQEKYVPDADIPGIYRLDGLVEGSTMQIKPLNRAYNYAAASLRVGNDTFAAIDMKDYGVWNTIGIHIWSANGTSIIYGDGDSWSPSDAPATGRYYKAARELDYFLRLLYLTGFNPTVKGLNYSGYVWTTAHDAHSEAEYLTGFTDLASAFRSRFSTYGSLTVPIIWDKLDAIDSGAEGQNWRDALDTVVANDPTQGFFDFLQYQPMNADHIHPKTWSVRMFGKFVASFFEHQRSGNNFPTVSNVSILGTLKQGQAISANWTYADSDGDLEGQTEFEILYADDVSGTNTIRIGKYFKGDSGFVLLSTQLNKYIKVRVTPVSQTGAKIGRPSETTWQGPVAAP